MNSCYNCPKREVGCHSYCLDYKQYKEKLETTNENRKIDKWYGEHMKLTYKRSTGKHYGGDRWLE